MDFIWTNSENPNAAEQVIWKGLSTFLKDEDGFCYHRYPVFSADRSRREPDILLFHRHWGLYVIECKGCNINNIERIDGQKWTMKDWHSSEEFPYAQAEDQMFEILGKFSSERNLRVGRERLIQGHAFIGLPFISKREWMDKGLHLSPAAPNTIIFADDLMSAEKLLERLQAVPAEEKQKPISDEQWQLAVGVLQGSPVLRREPRPEPKKKDSRAAQMRFVEQQMLSIDRDQHKIAVQIPNGPQRIRGLAGSGKTVIMCMKAAHMHLKHPEWDIAYTFYTRSLADQVKTLITRFYRYWSDKDPNWDKVHILHGWGAQDAPGMYRYICHKMAINARTYTEAEGVFNYKHYNEVLGACCKELISHPLFDVPELFDAILIDEAQDFHFNFYKLCHAALREPKRLVWAYDEVQSLENLIVPTTIDIFGTYPDGSLVVDLEGTYPDSDIEKDMVLYKCYRTPRPILIAAHIFGMGLLRPKGAIQFIPTQGGWEDIGYEIVSGQFQPGQQIVIRRPEKNSPHALERLVPSGELIQWKAFKNRDEELEWVADQVANDIQVEELKPSEITIISLAWKDIRNIFTKLQHLLTDRGIKAIRSERGVYQKIDHVTITSIFPAKGNESSVVYIVGFDQIGTTPSNVVQERNQVFTAMTRTRGWCVLTGAGHAAAMNFKEIAEICSDLDQVSFIVPDPATIKRNLDNLEYERRRNRMKKAQELAKQLAQILDEIDDPQLRQQMIQRLGGINP